jgi:hypothetical protein
LLVLRADQLIQRWTRVSRLETVLTLLPIQSGE